MTPKAVALSAECANFLHEFATKRGITYSRAVEFIILSFAREEDAKTNTEAPRKYYTVTTDAVTERIDHLKQHANAEYKRIPAHLFTPPTPPQPAKFPGVQLKGHKYTAYVNIPQDQRARYGMRPIVHLGSFTNPVHAARVAAMARKLLTTLA